MEQPVNGGEKRSLIETAKWLSIRAVFVAGIVFICIVIFTVILTILPKTGPQTEAFNALKMDLVRDWNRIIEVLKNGTTTTPDTPIVVRGGSLNLFSNSPSGRWVSSVNKHGYLFQGDAIKTPNSLFLDGVSTATYPVPHGADPDPTQITISPSNNWAITLALRNSESTVKICTLLTQDGNGCNTSPSGSLNSSKVYFEAGHSDLVGIDDFDRTDVKGRQIGARIHYTVPYCTLSNGSAGNDSDTDCDKISTVTINLGDGSSPTVYTCIDGACDIKIDHQ